MASMYEVTRSIDMSTGKVSETVYSGEYTVIATCAEGGECREFANGSSLWWFPPEVQARKDAAHRAGMTRLFAAIKRAKEKEAPRG